MEQRTKERLGGTLITALGAGGTVWNWQRALTEGAFSLKAAMLFPAFAVLGLGLLLFPGYRTERLARGEDISSLSGLALLTARWRFILVLALAAGGVNFTLMKF